MRLRIPIILLILINALPAYSVGRHNKETKALLNHLRLLSNEKKTLFGQFDTYYSGFNWLIKDSDTAFIKSDIYDICGDYPVIFGFDFNGIKQTSNKKAAIKHHERGGIITISWHMNNLITGGNAWDRSSDKVVHSILNDEQTKKEFCKQLDSFASFCLKLRGNDGFLIPVLFRPWHESTSKSFWWGDECCSDKDYKKLWKFTYTYLVKKKKVTNLIWVFSLDKMSSENEFSRRYPGNKYVDIIGFEKYQYWTDKETKDESIDRFRNDLRNGLLLLSYVCKKHNKIPAVTELGFAGGVPTNFWTYCVEDVVRDFPLAYISIWSNANDNRNRVFGPYPEFRDSKVFKQLIQNKRVLLLNGLNNKE